MVLKMSAENLACCLKCQMTFKTHEELFVHSCAQIKVEKPELEDDNSIEKYTKLLNTFHQQDFKYDIDHQDFSESDSDYSPKKKSKKEKKFGRTKVVKKKEKVKPNVRKIEEDNPKVEGKKKRGRPKIKKEKPNEEFDDKLNILQDNICDGMNLGLTEEFIIFILQQVDELCENIQNGDPDAQRKLEVNQNLNNAVSCYRSKLDLGKQLMVESDNELNKRDYADNDYYPEINENKTKAKVRKYGCNMCDKTFTLKGSLKTHVQNLHKSKDFTLKKKKLNDEKVKFVKNQCGKHSVNIMSCMLNMNYSTLQLRIEKEKIEFTEKQGECYFCDLKKSNDAIDKAHLFPLLKYNHDKKRIECTVCNFSSAKSKRGHIFTHIKSIHKDEIDVIAASDKEEKIDCGKSECRKLYGMLEGKPFWCAKCVEVSELPLTKRPKPEPLKKVKLCPECGVSVQHLKTHLEDVHYSEKQICPQCDKEVGCKRTLKAHIKKVHEKLPCSECGKLVSNIRMHMESAHTANEKLKYKCDICGKGFASKQRIEDHKNVHTGEKPHKCQFCSACFASFGNMRMHERGHLGHKRK